MAAVLRKLLFLVFGIVAFLVVAGIVISLLIDPNDYRDEIAAEVKRETGRDLHIEGDLELSLFPWLALNVGRTTLGNAPGFGDEPFLSFDEARLSIEVMPLIFGDGVHIGAIVLDAFELNLAVARDGRNNWQDIPEHAEAQREAEQDDAEPDAGAGDDVSGEGDITLSVASIRISNAAVGYDDAQAGESYRLTNFNFETGRISGADPIDIESSFDFELQPAGLAGDFSIVTSLQPSEEHGIQLGVTEISTMGIDLVISPDWTTSTAAVAVPAFSPKSLMQRLNIEPPVTADPAALGSMQLGGSLELTEQAFALTDVAMRLDDTNFRGSFSVARDEKGTISIDLAGDSIDLGRYMEPASDAAAAGGDTVPVEIPTDLIRALNVRGNLALDSALLSGMRFDNVRLGLNVADGNLRMHPISARLFEGSYEGDVRINASGSVPSLSVNENIKGVSLGALAAAMFDAKNVTGTINGAFRLGGRGADLGAIQRDLDGSITMELVDGAFEGTDVWYELRKARALLRQEEPPQPTLPARTQFSNVRLAGPVTDGVFNNNELFAELPFMQLSGGGTVNLPAATLDYRITARFLDKPEFASNATPGELKDFTKAQIPIRITGSLADPSVAPDLEGYLKKEAQKKVEEEIKDRLLDKLLRDKKDE